MHPKINHTKLDFAGLFLVELTLSVLGTKTTHSHNDFNFYNFKIVLMISEINPNLFLGS